MSGGCHYVTDPQSTPTPCYSIEEAARVSGIKVGELADAAHRCELTTHRDGGGTHGAVRVTEVALARYVSRRKGLPDEFRPNYRGIDEIEP